MSALRELLASFDIDTGGAKVALKSLDQGIKATAGMISGLAETLIGGLTVNGFKHFVEGQIEIGSRLNDLSERLGIGISDLQEFQLAAGVSGVGAEEAAKGLQFLNKNLGEAIGGNAEAAKTFQSLGIAFKDGGGNARELADIIPEVADSFEKLGSDQERTAVAMKIFGKSGASLIPLLKQGSGGLEEIHKRFVELGGGMQGGFVKAADEAGDEIDILKFGLQGLKSRLAAEVLPYVTAFVRKAQTWVAGIIKLTKETNIVKDALVVFGAAASAAGLKAAIGMGKFLGIFKGGGLFKNLLSMGLFGLVVGGLLAIYLVVQDLVVMFRGGKSAIGEFVDGLFGVGTVSSGISMLNGVISHLQGAFQELKPVLGEAWAALSDLGGAFGISLSGGQGLLSWLRDEFVSAIHTAIDAVTVLIATLTRMVTLGAKVASAVGKGDLNSILNAGGALTGIAERPGTVYEDAPKVHTQERGIPAGATINTGGNNINITVQGGKTNAETGRAVANSVDGALTQRDINAAAASTGNGGPRR